MRAVTLALLMAGAAWGAAPRAAFTPEQATLLRESDGLWKAGNEAWEAGKKADAIAALKKVLALDSRLLGPWHRDTEATAGRLADWHRARGEWAEEAGCRRLVMEARRVLNGEGHWEAIDAGLALAEALAQAKRAPAQREALRKAEGLNERAAGLLREGKAKEALPLAREALALRKEVLGERHPDYAASLHNLASLHTEMREHGEALPLFKEALAIHKEVLGERHPNYAQSLNNLALLHGARGDPAAALPLLKEALAIRKAALGERHPLYARSLNNLAGFHLELRQHGEALPLFKRALALTKAAQGERHPDYANSLHNLAGLHKAMGEYAAALPMQKEALAIYKEALGERHPHYALSLGGLAGLHKEMGQYVEALPLYKRALAVTKAALGSRHPQYALSLGGLAVLHKEMGQHGEALPLFKQALAINKGVLGERHPNYATSLISLAEMHKDMGEYAAALPLYKRALAIYKEAPGERHPLYATGLHNLAGLHQKMGDYGAALPLCKRALAVRKEVLGERHPDYVSSLHSLALLHGDMGEHGEALPLFKRALAITKEALGERHPDYATYLYSLAVLHQAIGGHKAALPLFKEALAVTRAALGERHHLYALRLNSLAMLHSAMGEYAEALPLHKRALAIYKEALGERHPLYASGLHNLAVLHHAMGDHAAALPLYKQALALAKAALGERHPDYATSLNSLALLHVDMGGHGAALPLSEEALAVTKAALGERHPDYARSLNSLAVLHKAMGEHAAALPLLKEALAIYKEAPGERHPDYATGLYNLATLHSAMGEHGEALPLHERALAIYKEALGERHPLYAHSLGGLAGLYLAKGRPGAALLLQEQAMRLTRRQLALDASIQSERQQRAAAHKFRHRLNIRLSMPDEAAHFSHNHILWWKGFAFAAQQARRRFLLAEADPGTRALALELRDRTRSLALLSSRADAASRKRAEGLILEKEDLEARLARLSGEFRLALRPPTSEQLRATLPAGVVLIDYLVHTGFDPEKPLKGQKWGRRLIAWVVRADAPTVRIDLGPMGPIEGAIASWRKAIEKGRGRGSEEEVPPLEKGHPPGLRGRVWDPLEEHLTGAKVVLVSPDGALGGLPFVALPGRREGTFLLEEVPLAVLPVPQVLEQTLRLVKGKPSILTVGGVDFGEGKKPWEPLPATGPEADAVAARFRDRLKGSVFPLSGAKATKAALREALPKHRYAHLATHGYFAPASMKSAEEVDGKSPDDLFGREGVTGWDPALLSGLVLAGANRRTAEDDGLLKASEIAEMDLSMVELAVLSACQTGLGKEAAGEGILGLQRAFAMAGCKSVVSSLWSVHDAATAVLMERFYHHLWQKKLSKLEALRQAQLDVLRNPGWVGEREKRLAGTRGLRGVGEVAESVVDGKKVRTSPVAWWAAWQLSGDWR